MDRVRTCQLNGHSRSLSFSAIIIVTIYNNDGGDDNDCGTVLSSEFVWFYETLL